MSNDIYTYIEDNFNIKVTDYTFKRDYIKEPLRKGSNGLDVDKPYKEDLEYLYLSLNISQSNLAKLFGKSRSRISVYAIEYGLNKSQESMNKSRKESCMMIYGVESNMCLANFKESARKTKLKKYGSETYNNREKYNQTCLKKYGTQIYSQTEEWKIRTKETNKQKYGSEWVVQTDNFKNKSAQTCIQRYGYKSYMQTDECKRRIYNTKNEHQTHNISKPEDEIYIMLVQLYGNVIRQYKSDLYPFNCDFFIPSIDTYIEYQGMWTHGREPYIGNEEQLLKVENYKKKNTDFYNKMINDWTIRDPLKRKTAFDNNLKWIEFFNMKQFMDWYEKQLDKKIDK